MQAGKLDRRLTLRRKTTTTDEFGAEIATWADVATVWASKQDVSDGERVRAQQVGARITTRFQVRWGSVTKTISAEDQVVCEGVLYEVTARKEIGRREGVEITATAQADVA